MVLLSMFLVVSSPAQAASDSCALLDRFNSQAQMPLAPLTERECASLDAHEIVTTIQRRSDGEYRVIGLTRTPLGRGAVWLSTQDEHFAGKDAIETDLGIRPHHATWYGMLDVPKPFADRHWVIDVWDNTDLAKKTHDQFWEHPWKKNETGLAIVRERVARGEVEGLDLPVFDKAVELPINEGSLVFLRADNGDTIYIYQVVSDVGGGIPTRLVAAWVRKQMGSHIRGVLQRAEHEVPGHYRGSHAAVLGGGESTIPFFP